MKLQVPRMPVTFARKQPQQSRHVYAGALHHIMTESDHYGCLQRHRIVVPIVQKHRNNDEACSAHVEFTQLQSSPVLL
jgi:hypothetical protein